jgi:hypothetical protein
MPYSRRLMTLIFIKPRLYGAGAIGDRFVSPVPGSRHGKAVMPTDVQRLAFRDAVTRARIDPIGASRQLAYAMLTSGRG